MSRRWTHISKGSTTLKEIRVIMRKQWNLNFSNKGKSQLRDLYAEKLQRPLENRFNELIEKLAQLQLHNNGENSALNKKDEIADASERLEAVPQDKSPVMRIQTLLAELRQCARQIDLHEFIGSKSRRELTHFKESESKAITLLEQEIKIGNETLDLYSLVAVLTVVHSCVATAASVAVLRSHNRRITSAQPINRYVRHYQSCGSGPNAGASRAAWANLKLEAKEKVRKELARDEADLASMRLRHPQAFVVESELTELLLTLKLGDVTFVGSSKAKKYSN